jgi:hypothetical protein
MTERTIQVDLPAHLKSEEGAARFNAAVARRDQADFRCFEALRDLVESATIYGGSLKAVLTKGCFDRDEETCEVMEYRAEQVAEALEERRQADADFADALYGRTR